MTASSVESTSRPWLVALALASITLAALGPYVAVGPDDFEEYFTGVVTTQLAWDGLFDGALPLWNVNLGLGLPQPFRFHFMTHPMAPLCTVADCQQVLRVVASVHVFLGCLFMALLARRFVQSSALALLAGLTYLMSSSVVQPILTDDWPLTAINESALPVLVYLVTVLGEPRWPGMLVRSLALGWIGGMLLSMSFPVVTLAAAALVAVTGPGFKRQWPWLVLAAAITLLIGGAQLHHIYTEVSLSPAGMVRREHGAVDPANLLWSLFMRPIALPNVELNWRSAYLGAPFAVLAVWAAVSLWARNLLPLRVGFVLGLAAMFIPSRWFYDVNTALWLYRTEVNIFGTLLAVCLLGRWETAPARRRWVRVLCAAQLCWLVAAFVPPWLPIARVAIGLDPPGRHRLKTPGVAHEIVRAFERRPGRVILAPEAHAATLRPTLNAVGLAANQLAVLDVPTVSAVASGLTTDELSPQIAVLDGEVRAVPSTVTSRTLLDVLGIRYVVGLNDEAVAPGLRLIQRLEGNLQLYENDTAWPEAFFVDSVPQAPIPRLDGCPHEGLLCADFSRYALQRRSEPVRLARLHDGLRLSFEPSVGSRYLLVTQWFRPGWIVTDGRASVARAAEQMVLVRVEEREDTVTIRFRPRARVLWLAVSVAIQLSIGGAIVALAVASANRRTRVA